MPPTPFPGADLNLTAATPFRKTRVLFGLPEYRRQRLHWSAHPVGGQLASQDGHPAGINLNVTLLPSGSWCISSWEMMMQFERSDVISGNLILASDLAAGFENFYSQSQIPGVTYDTAVPAAGSYWARKRKSASSDWHAELGSDFDPDTGGIPKPPADTANVPMRRVAKSSTTLSANQGAYLRFYGPGGPLTSQDALVTFYFGGAIATNWADPAIATQGGRFAISLFGDGSAITWEMTRPTGSPNLWRALETWTWEDRGRVANREHVLIVLPEGRDKLNILGVGGRQHLLQVSSQNAGYVGKLHMTGAGPLRLDLREDLRLPFQFGFLKFPTGGPGGPPNGAALYGLPFKVPYPIAAGAQITAEMDTVAGGGVLVGAVSLQVFAGNDGSELTSDGAPSPTFTTASDTQRDYYPVYTLTSSANDWTPFLRGCNFRLEGVRALYTPTPFTGGQIKEVAITGPGTEVDFEHAAVLIEDEQSILADGPAGSGGLERHADIHCQIQTQYQDPALGPPNQWVLFDGVLVSAAGRRTGKDFGQSYPSPRWKTWRIELAGQWHRLAEPWQILWSARNWAKDPLGAVDPVTGDPLRWRIIDILAELFRQAGFDDSQIALTNPPGTPATGPGGSAPGPRLFVDLNHPENVFILPGAQLGTLIQRLAKDYLNAHIVWDKEALPNGRWITVYGPALSGTYSTLWSFRTAGLPADTSGLALLPVHMPGAWPTGTTFVREYSTWVKPPEANLFIVLVAVGAPQEPDPVGRFVRQTLTGGGPVGNEGLSAAVGVNWRSTKFDGYPDPDPTSMDFIPYGIKPAVFYRPDLAAGPDNAATNENCRYMCRRYMDAGAYGLKYFQWLAPLVAYFDPDAIYGGGPRTLRVGDLVEFNEDGTLHTVLLTSVNPQIGLPEGDLCQQMHCEGYALPVPLSY